MTDLPKRFSAREWFVGNTESVAMCLSVVHASDLQLKVNTPKQAMSVEPPL